MKLAEKFVCLSASIEIMRYMSWVLVMRQDIQLQNKMVQVGDTKPRRISPDHNIRFLCLYFVHIS